MHSFAPYILSVPDRSLPGKADQKFHRLNMIRGKDLIAELKGFCDSHSATYHTVEEEKSKKAIKFSNVTVTDREIYGVIETGDFGIKGKVVDVDKGDTVYRKKAKDSDVYQLYFHFLIPKNAKRAVCVFHNIHGRGVKGIFLRLFNEHFSKSTKGLTLRMRPFSYDKVVEKWMENATVKELRLQKYSVKDELSDVASTLEDSVADLVLKPKGKGKSFGPLKNFAKTKKFTGKKRNAVEVMGEQCHSIKALVEHDGRKRVFSLKADSTPISNIEISEDDVEMDEGVPKFNSLKIYTKTLLQDLIKSK